MSLNSETQRRLIVALASVTAGAEIANILQNPSYDATNAIFTGTGTMVAGQKILVVNKAAGAATAVTLPPTPALWETVYIKDGKGDAQTNNITISGAAAATIDGLSTLVLNTPYATTMLMWNGTQWNILDVNNQSPSGLLTLTNGVTVGPNMVQSKTANYALVAADTGSYFDNTGAAGSVTFTLPAVATSKGFTAYFFCVVNQPFIITAPAGTLVGANSSTNTTYTDGGTGKRIGTSIFAYCNGINWFIFLDVKGLTLGAFS
jgi:hypothetical protein